MNNEAIKHAKENDLAQENTSCMVMNTVQNPKLNAMIENSRKE